MTIRIDITHTFHVPVGEAFAYITDTGNWAKYWPDFVRINDPANARWGQPGDRITVVLKLLGRERELNMELENFQRDTVVTYRSHQRGLPDARHERHFETLSEGTEYRLVVEFEARPRLAGLFDRLIVRRAVTRAMHKTIDNLDQVFLQRGAQS